MKRFIDKVLTTVFFAGVMLILGSCVAERLDDDCLDVRLLIKTDHDTGKWDGSTRARTRTSDIENWYNGIDSVDVYIFDENEKFVTVWEGGPYVSGQDYEVPLKEIGLSEGVYTFVAWTDPGHHYVSNLEELMNMIEPGEGEEGEEPVAEPTAPEFSLSDMRMHINLDTLVNGSGAIEEDLHHRHHGILPRAYVSNHSILYPKPATIEISPSLHKVNFTVVGISSHTLDDRDDFTLSVIDKNSAHDFRNNYVPDLGRDYKHIRPLNVVSEPGQTRVDENTMLSTSMHLMQLHDNTMTGIEIHNDMYPDEPIHVEENLVDLIRMAYSDSGYVVDDEFFKEMLEFDVKIDLRTYPTIVLTINGWQYIYITGRIAPSHY